MKTTFILITAGSLCLFTGAGCADNTVAPVSSQPATVVTGPAISSVPGETPFPTPTTIPVTTQTPSPAPIATALPLPAQPTPTGNPSRITSFTVEKTQGNGILFTWAAIGMSAKLCPLFGAETLSYDCRGIFSYVGYETEIAGSDLWPADEFGAPYTGFSLSVEGANGTVETVEVAVAGLACAQEWFFANPTDRCPTPSETSVAMAQRFEHGQMIWIEKLAKFYIFYDSGLQAWPTNLDIVGPLALKANASVDNRTGETAPPGYIEPMGNFSLIWRGEGEGPADIRERLGWAKEPEFGFETIYQCSVGLDSLGCPPNYLRDPEGKILNLYYLLHFGYYWEEQSN